MHAIPRGVEFAPSDGDPFPRGLDQAYPEGKSEGKAVEKRVNQFT
jgi:hypothetical protein